MIRIGPALGAGDAVAVMLPVRSPRAGLLVSLAGVALVAAVQLVAPLPGPPLYDGVVTVDPYRYVLPTGSEPGGAQGQTRSGSVTGGTSPIVAFGTPEQPPQAQLIINPGALSMPSGTTALTATIVPVPPDGSPPSESIVGNVYRVTIVNQAGAPVTGIAGKQVTLALRDPGSTGIVRINQFVDGAWQPLQTVSASVSGTYETTGLTTFGDFALVGSPSDAGSGSALATSPVALATGAVVVVVLGAAAATFVKRRIGRAR